MDVKIIAATTADLGGYAAAGRFRPDLYHRLAVVVVTLTAPFPARLHVLMASKMPRAIVLRRGPSKHVCTVGWNLEDDSFVPEDLRLTYKILKNSNCLPIEMELRKEVFNLRQLLNAAIDAETRRELRRELNLLTLNLNIRLKRLPLQRVHAD